LAIHGKKPAALWDQEIVQRIRLKTAKPEKIRLGSGPSSHEIG